MVHRDRILAWRREHLSALAADLESCSKNTGNYEMVWHAMFGEPLSQPARDKDPRLLMRLRWSVDTKYSPGDEYVV